MGPKLTCTACSAAVQGRSFANSVTVGGGLFVKRIRFSSALCFCSSMQFLVSVFAILLLATLSSAMAAGDLVGAYKGNVLVSDTGKRVPVEMVVMLSNTPPPNNPGGPVDMQKTFNVAFVVDIEGGPYKASNAIYDISDSSFEVSYFRSAGSTGTGGVPNLRFSGTLSADTGVFSGTLYSGSTGTIGDFRLERVGPVRPIVTKAKYVGRWSGPFQYTSTDAGGQTGKLTIQLAPSPSTFTNPSNYDLEFAAGKIGGLDLDGLQLGFSSVAIDYFRRKMVLTYQANARLDIFCDLLDDGTLSGVVNATYTGQTGTFKLPRSQ